MFGALKARAICFASCSYRTLATAAISTSRVKSRPIPPPTQRVQTAEAFLTAIGRSSNKKLKVESWEELWQMDGYAMKKQGVSVQDRRYILWAMEKFRGGEDIARFAHEPKPKKKIRGRGPAVQNGKRIRSRRKQ